MGLEAGALAGGVVGAHHLGLGHHTVLLLRKGIAICRTTVIEHFILQVETDQFTVDLFTSISSQTEVNSTTVEVL